MGRTKLALGALVSVLLVCFSLPTIRAFAKYHMSMSDMITMAKTSAEHEKLAAAYEQEAKAAAVAAPSLTAKPGRALARGGAVAAVGTDEEVGHGSHGGYEPVRG